MGQLKELINDPTVNIHVTDSINGWTPLHRCLRFLKRDKLIHLVRILTENGTDVNGKTENGITPHDYLYDFNRGVKNS